MVDKTSEAWTWSGTSRSHMPNYQNRGCIRTLTWSPRHMTHCFSSLLAKDVDVPFFSYRLFIFSRCFQSFKVRVEAFRIFHRGFQHANTSLDRLSDAMSQGQGLSHASSATRFVAFPFDQDSPGDTPPIPQRNSLHLKSYWNYKIYKH